MSTPGYIISVFQAAGMCTGNFDPASVVARLKIPMEAEHLLVESWESVTQDACFAVVLFARARDGVRVDLLQLRRRLTELLSPQQLQLRVQREDVFLAMHRL